MVGRRSGKTRIAAAISAYVGAIEQHDLAPGETGYVLLLAASRSQASVAFNYVTGFLQSSPILRQQIEGVTTDEVRLRGNVVIGVHAGSFRTIRGRTVLAVVGDESSFWRDETSAQPDVEIFRACAPALAASGGLLVGISTGYRKIGLLYQKWRDHFGQPGDDVLVVQGDSAAFNLTLDPAMIERARAADPEAAESEWGAGFRADIAAFLDDATIDAAVDPGRPMELPPRRGIRYEAFADPSGGRHDAFTLCIGHKEGEGCVADVIRGRHAPFDPHAIVAEYASLLKDYGVTTLTGDNYSAAWSETAFKDAGISYKRSEMAKSQLYLEALPLFMRGAVSIPDHARQPGIAGQMPFGMLAAAIARVEERGRRRVGARKGPVVAHIGPQPAPRTFLPRSTSGFGRSGRSPMKLLNCDGIEGNDGGELRRGARSLAIMARAGDCRTQRNPAPISIWRNRSVRPASSR